MYVVLSSDVGWSSIWRYTKKSVHIHRYLWIFQQIWLCSIYYIHDTLNYTNVGFSLSNFVDGKRSSHRKCIQLYIQIHKNGYKKTRCKPKWVRDDLKQMKLLLLNPRWILSHFSISVDFMCCAYTNRYFHCNIQVFCFSFSLNRNWVGVNLKIFMKIRATVFFKKKLQRYATLCRVFGRYLNALPADFKPSRMFVWVFVNVHINPLNSIFLFCELWLIILLR